LNDLREEVVSDRPLSMAITSFAPGAELVNDGLVHSAVGFVAYLPAGRDVKTTNPLGAPYKVGKCPRCKRVELGEAVRCTACNDDLQPMNVFEPRGFRTDYDARAYDDDRDVITGAGVPELSVNSAPSSEHQLPHLSVALYPEGRLVSINDNQGLGYTFNRQQDGSVIADFGRRDARIKEVIGEFRTTDALLLTPKFDVPTGAIALHDQISGRAAYTSFAEVLRRGAQVALDLDPNELAVGLTPLRLPILGSQEPDVKAQVAAAIFLADTAENGAGYAVELGQPDVLTEMLETIAGSLRIRWEDAVHTSKCDISCPDCLRSYDNSRRHALLDWRLALDLLELATGQDLTVSRSLPSWAQWMEVAANGLQGARLEQIEELPVIVRGDKCVLLIHPLWRKEMAYFTESQAMAFDEAQDRFASVALEDVRAFRRNALCVWSELQ
jgi:DEAD/DEAH box helicase domain-containing protein